MSEMLSVRQWQDLFRSGAFQDRSRETQIRAGWYDWFCADSALAGRVFTCSSFRCHQEWRYGRWQPP